MIFLIMVLVFIGVPIGIAIGIVLTVKYYYQIKTIISDVLRFFGWVGKYVRRKSLETEYEGTINGAIKEFNNNFESPILPNCEIQWINSENHQSYIKEGKAIICLNFDRRDHDLNFFNATYNFVKTGLVSKTKPFLRNSTKSAIDLLSTKIILRDYRRKILHVFNQKFKEEESETKDTFYKLEETEAKGLYSTILIPEFYYLGEILGEKTPNQAIELETEEFLEWFYNLASREHDEKTTLHFPSNHIKVGVILVAKLTTYEKYGPAAYTKWAEKYASENYGAVYLLAKGERRGNIAKEIAKELIESNGFEQVNKKTQFILTSEDRSSLLITCISLRPDIATIQYNAWEKLKKNYQQNDKVNAIIDSVSTKEVVVNIYGIRVTIDSKFLSSEEIPNCLKIFKKEQELILDIKEFDAHNQNILLSNVETETDPKILVDSVLNQNTVIEAKIMRIQKGQDNFQKGLFVKSKIPLIDIFIPRSSATYSRFSDLARQYGLDESIIVRLNEFSLEYGNYIGEVVNLSNPWTEENISKYAIGDVVEVIVQEITYNYLTCEIIEGLECRIYRFEYSWNEEECDSMLYKIGQKVSAKILNIDIEKHRIICSIKQISKSPSEVFFEHNKEKVISGKITNIAEGLGLTFETGDALVIGFIPLRELMWGFCRKISENFSIGDPIKVKIIEYKKDSDSIWFSLKRRFINEFSKFVDSIDIGDLVNGKVIHHFKDIVRIELNKNEVIAQAYIHKSEISNIAFLDEFDLERFLEKNNIYNFAIKRIDEKNEIIELSRKNFLSSNVSNLTYEDVIKGKITKITREKIFFYSDEHEGFVKIDYNNSTIGKTIEIYPINLSSMEFKI